MRHLNPESIFQKSGDPTLAEHQWSLFQSAIEPDLLKNSAITHLRHLFGNSRFLVDFLLKHPEIVRQLVTSPYLQKHKGRDQMDAELQSFLLGEFAGTLTSIQKILRHYKYREMVRIAVRDLAGLASFEEIGLELSFLAGACIAAAQEASFALLEKKFQVLANHFMTVGLGKLGGGDLNFSSDIDILYLCRLAGDDTHSSYEACTRAANMITEILQDRTGDGLVFRVDLNLRPEGKSGPIVNTLEALATYYEISGAPWERAALTKAHPVAGDRILGEQFLAQIEPFVFRKSIDFSVIAELKSLKEKIDQEFQKSKTAGFNVKLGKGGIREIEFFATSFQLVYGGKEPRLRGRNTLETLEILRELKLIPAKDAGGLREAYLFLRRIENRLQMVDDLQIHTLPTDKNELLALSRRVGFHDSAQLLETLDKWTELVFSCFEGLAP